MATSVAITASAKETALPSPISKALDQSLPCTEVTLLLNRDQPPAKPGDNSQDDHNSDKRDHHESKAKTAGPELLIVSQVVTHDPSSIEQCVMHSMQASTASHWH